MRISAAILIFAAVILALPVGWGIGVVLAYAIAGPEFGQLPALTVPVSIIAAIVFALSPAVTAPKRLAIMAAATALFVLLAVLSSRF